MKALPVVALIGQTNVGKSSLFNRITRSRAAIVAREEGTTRDSVQKRVEFDGSSFLLIDTAGLKKPTDEFESSIQDQIDDAVNNADLILFTTDSTKYLDQKDQNLIRVALKSKKPVLLLANKSDLRDSLSVDEFSRTGIRQVFKVSAEHNIGIDEVLREIVSNLPVVSSSFIEPDVKIALIGRPNVGKSSLFNTLANKQQAIVANLSGTTRDINRVSIKYNGKTIEILDTAGVRKKGKQEVGIEKFSALRTLSAIEESDICLLMIDATEPHNAFDQNLAGQIKDAGKGLVFVLSKWDLVDAEMTDNILRELHEDFNFAPFAPVIFTSSMTGKNVTKLLELAEQIMENRKREIKTNELNKVLLEATSKHPPAGLKNTMPKLRYCVQTDVNPPWFVIHGSNLKLLHWSYKRYLERTFREHFEFSGTPIEFSFRERDDKK
ncbi:MAG: ribosome biogenesis GTPase Der [Candidatus Nomurabacteria bacterium]|jgi:GTP-binding protein|nr:ribosome biogenesis GTPase Der [Candidatus Nomurabacteria bacterium]